MSKIGTCYGCNDRYVGCHDHCEKYQKAKKELEEEKERMLNAKTADNLFMDYKQKSIHRWKRAK